MVDYVSEVAIPTEEEARREATHEYLFDIEIFASIRVRAESEEAAQKLIQQHINCADCNAGSWPNGDPITFEASVYDDGFSCVEVDREET